LAQAVRQVLLVQIHQSVESFQLVVVEAVQYQVVLAAAQVKQMVVQEVLQ
jgi:hypothetical protein